jgi:hypothetical protein
MWVARYGQPTIVRDIILTSPAAAIFGYFEQLLQHGDAVKIASEMARLKAFNPSLPALDFDLETVEMFMEPAMELLEKMQNALLRQDRDSTFLLETMNRDEDSNSILYYFKVCRSRVKRRSSSPKPYYLDLS